MTSTTTTGRFVYDEHSHPPYRYAQELRWHYRNGGVVEFEGMLFEISMWHDIQPGDTYLAGRNSGIKMLTARDVNVDMGWIIPEEESGYPYDLGECYKIMNLEEQMG